MSGHYSVHTFDVTNPEDLQAAAVREPRANSDCVVSALSAVGMIDAREAALMRFAATGHGLSAGTILSTFGYLMPEYRWRWNRFFNLGDVTQYISNGRMAFCGQTAGPVPRLGIAKGVNHAFILFVWNDELYYLDGQSGLCKVDSEQSCLTIKISETKFFWALDSAPLGNPVQYRDDTPRRADLEDIDPTGTKRHRPNPAGIADVDLFADIAAGANRKRRRSVSALTGAKRYRS